MADAGITIDVSGLVRKLERAGKQLEPRGLLKAIGLRQLRWIDQNFKERGALVGGWKPITEFTKAHRLHGGDAPLQDSGHLKGSFNSHVVDDTKVRVGTPYPFASYLNDGTGPIRPVRAKALRIPGPNGPTFLAFTHGIPARRMLPTLAVGKKLAKEVLEARMRKLDNGGA